LVGVREEGENVLGRGVDADLANDVLGFGHRSVRPSAPASAASLIASRPSSQKLSRNRRISKIFSARARYKRCVPLRRSSTSPASFRMRRCFEIAGRLTSKWLATSPAARSWLQTSRRISCRRGSAMAFRATIILAERNAGITYPSRYLLGRGRPRSDRSPGQRPLPYSCL